MTRGHTECRSCGSRIDEVVLDLGSQPLANSYVEPGEESSEQRYPLCTVLCTSCGLVQVGDVVPPEEIFSDYAYFSSFSDSWVEHARRFALGATERFGLGPSSLVVEIASNDGYLLQHFVGEGVPVLGVEPAANVAEVAVAKGIETEVAFFGRETAERLLGQGRRADLIVGNNVMAHVPDLNDFIGGIALLLADDGVVSIEAPHLLRLVEGTQFDTIYHEHFSYFSLTAARAAFARHGLDVFDVEELPTHGGSLRIFGARAGSRAPSEAVAKVLADEAAADLTTPAGFVGFKQRVADCCDGLRSFLDDQRAAGTTVAAYGAAAKGNTLLNAAGVTSEMVAFVVDRNPAKQGRLLPGSHVPVHDVEHLLAQRPDHVLILPWNLRDEIAEQMASIREWGGHFVVAVPEIDVF